MCWHLPMIESYWQVKAGESEVQSSRESPLKALGYKHRSAKNLSVPQDTYWAELDQDSSQDWGRVLVAATVANKLPVPGSSGHVQNQPPGHLCHP